MDAELDPPLVESVKGKQGRRFGSVRRGYDPAQVDAFLLAVASSIDARRSELRELRLAPPSPAEGAAEGSTERIARIVEVGEREIGQIVVEAKAEAATIVLQATSEADRTTRAAQGDAKRSLEEARVFLDQVEDDARTLVAGADERRRQMIEEIQKMQERLVSIAQALELVLNPEGP